MSNSTWPKTNFLCTNSHASSFVSYVLYLIKGITAFRVNEAENLKSHFHFTSLSSSLWRVTRTCRFYFQNASHIGTNTGYAHCPFSSSTLHYSFWSFFLLLSVSSYSVLCRIKRVTYHSKAFTFPHSAQSCSQFSVYQIKKVQVPWRNGQSLFIFL